MVLEQRVGLLVEMETREEEETDKGTVGAEWEDRERFSRSEDKRTVVR